MAISKHEFLGLKPGKHAVVACGRRFEVVRNEPSDSVSDVPGPREVVLRDPGGTHFEVGWLDGDGIVDDNWGKSLDLNRPDAFVIDVGS